jgi:hypothetical protein
LAFVKISGPSTTECGFFCYRKCIFAMLMFHEKNVLKINASKEKSLLKECSGEEINNTVKKRLDL